MFLDHAVNVLTKSEGWLNYVYPDFGSCKLVFRVILLLSIGVLLGGCPTGGTYRYSGPSDATFSSFASSRNQCYQQLMASGASGSANQYGAYYQRGPTVSCGAFNACLAEKGYYKNSNGRFDASSISVSCQ